MSLTKTAQKSGPTPHLDLRVRRLEPSATLAINERSAELQALGRTIYRFGLGQSPFPVPQKVIRELENRASEKDYLPVAGLKELRKAVAAYHRKRDGVESGAEDVLIGPGSKELLFLAQLCFQGELIINSPSWVSYEPQAAILGLPTTWVPSSVEQGWRLDPEALEQTLAQDPDRPRLMILNTPNNPAGTALDRERLEQIAQVCRKARLLVLSDEIYGEVHHRGEHCSLAEFYPEGTIISSGLSKWCGAGGWRLGTFTFPPQLDWLRKAMAVVASETFTSVSAPIQWAAIPAFDFDQSMQDYLLRSRAILKAVGKVAHQRLEAAGLTTPKPDGGFYLFPVAQGSLAQSLNRRGISDSPKLCRLLLDECGVAVLPGTQFGRPPEELSFRLATVNFDGAKALKACSGQGQDLPASFVSEHCPALVEGLDSLTAWLRIET